MILVDTSVWIDHLHRTDARLVSLLESGEVCTHPFIIEELAMGRLAPRDAFLEALSGLERLQPVTHFELLALVNGSRLWGRGLNVIDAHVLAATLVTPGAALWTRDKRLAEAAQRLDVGLEPGS